MLNNATMSVEPVKRRISSILKVYSKVDGTKPNTSVSQNKVRFDDLSVEPILQEVLTNGVLQRYEHLVTLVREEQFDDGKYQQLLVDSKRCVYLLNADFGVLVEALLSTKWLTRNESCQEIYKDFVIELLVVQSNYISLAVSKLIQQFVPKDEETSGWSNGNPSEEILRLFKTVHDLIERLKTVIPMIFDVVLAQLRKQFPYFKKPTHVICGYLHNILLMVDYCPMFKEELLEIVFNRLLVIDVNVPRTDIENTEFPEDDEEMFVLDIEDRESMKLPLAETLDCCMEKMFTYIEHLVSTEKSKDGDRMFQMLLILFENHILPTHNTHHVQFLMFYFCSFKQPYAEFFITYLWKQVCNPNASTPIRQASVGYIASMLARGKFVHISNLKSTLQEFCDWIHKYIQRSDSMQYTQSLKAHMVFYSVCQALFYVIAFRSRQLTASNKNLAFLQSLQLSSIVTCHLNPLRVCLPAVATAFAGVTRAHQLAYCHTVLERNARRKLATVYKNDAQTPEECLDTFFPFDPYLLKKSGQRIEHIYLQYQVSDAEEEHVSSPTTQTSRKRYESMSEDIDDFIQEHKRFKGSDTHETHYTYSYGVSPGFHN